MILDIHLIISSEKPKGPPKAETGYILRPVWFNSSRIDEEHDDNIWDWQNDPETKVKADQKFAAWSFFD